MNSQKSIDKGQDLREDEEYDHYLEKFLKLYLEPPVVRNGFAHPHETTIPTLWEHVIEGSVHSCVVSLMYSTNELYLVHDKDFPNNVEDFIEETGKVLDKKIPQTPRAELTLYPKERTPGAIVCVKIDEKQEWQRGKIVKTKQVTEEHVSRTYYRIVTLDLGEYHVVDMHHVFYLPKELAIQPAFAVKARLQLDTFYDNRRKSKIWDEQVCKTMLNVLYGKSILVKFIRKLEKDNEVMWKVSLLRFKDKSRTCFPKDSRPIEQQVIAELFGNYVTTTTHLMWQVQ